MPEESISIRTIAKQYNTSVMPAREAVRWLVAEGALQFVDSRKIIVPRLTPQRCSDLLFLRRSLEGELSERAYSRIGRTEIAALKKNRRENRPSHRD